MKNLLHTTFKAFSLTIVTFSLASGSLLAGGNDDKIAKNDSSSKIDDNTEYAEALLDMEESLLNAQQAEEIFESAPKIKIYDTELHLVKEIGLKEEGVIQDKEILSLIRQSSIFMKSDNTTFYIMNN